jgi:hypothetical protein
MTVDELFVRQSKTWGLRGDPRVWEEMRGSGCVVGSCRQISSPLATSLRRPSPRSWGSAWEERWRRATTCTGRAVHRVRYQRRDRLAAFLEVHRTADPGRSLGRCGRRVVPARRRRETVAVAAPSVRAVPTGGADRAAAWCAHQRWVDPTGGVDGHPPIGASPQSARVGCKEKPNVRSCTKCLPGLDCAPGSYCSHAQ